MSVSIISELVTAIFFELFDAYLIVETTPVRNLHFFVQQSLITYKHETTIVIKIIVFTLPLITLCRFKNRSQQKRKADSKPAFQRRSSVAIFEKAPTVKRDRRILTDERDRKNIRVSFEKRVKLSTATLLTVSPIDFTLFRQKNHFLWLRCVRISKKTIHSVDTYPREPGGTGFLDREAARQRCAVATISFQRLFTADCAKLWFSYFFQITRSFFVHVT